MKITKIEAEWVLFSFPMPVRGTPMEHGCLLVTVETADEIVGAGVARDHDFLGLAVRQIILNDIAPLLLDGDFTSPAKVWNEAALASPRDYRAPVGAVARAVSAVDQALWDIWGQHLGQPIYRLLGGAQSEIEIYTTCGLKAFTAEEEAEEVRRLQAQGFRAFKLEGSWADRGRDSKHDVGRVRQLREVAGDDALIIIDGRNVFDLYQAIDIARKIEPYGVAFLDEPVQAKDPETMRRLRAAVPGVPIAARARGGNIYDIRDLVVGNAVDVLSTTVLDQGGYTTAQKSGHLAQMYGLRLVTGGGWHLQNAHFIAAMPNGWMTEYLTPAALVTDRLFIDPPHPANGKLVLGDKPGLGMKLNPDAVKDGRARARSSAGKH